jgi:hypothetical protein
MNFENSWYLIESHGRTKVASYEEFSKLEKNEFVLIENFAIHHEALIEYQRLIKLEITEAKEKLNSLKSGK